MVTNIDREHLDHFGSEEALFAAFLDFAEKVPFYGLVVIGADNPAAARLAPLSPNATPPTAWWRATGAARSSRRGPGGTRFRVRVRGRAHGEARVRMPGVHYAGNALAALCVADFLGVPFTTAGEALAQFEGVDRRFSVRGEAADVLVVDDYGHHPTELAATIAAARLYGRRLVVAFQPHRFTRTRDLLARVRARAGRGRRAAADRRLRRRRAAHRGRRRGGAAGDLPRRRRARHVRATGLPAALPRPPPRRSRAVPRRGRHHRRADELMTRCAARPAEALS